MKTKSPNGVLGICSKTHLTSRATVCIRIQTTTSSDQTLIRVSACAKNNKPEDCCTGEYNSASKCQPSDYSKNVKAVCPDAYSYGKPYPVLFFF
jgi:hypothetical protein